MVAVAKSVDAQRDLELRLESGCLQECLDADGKRVRISYDDGEWILWWGDEPGWRGDSSSIARFYLLVTRGRFAPRQR